MTPDRGQAGFTLVELLVVLAIVSLTLAISLPYSTRFGEARRMDGLAEVIAAHLKQAEAQALAEGRDRSVTITLAKDAISLSDDTSPLRLPEGASVTILSAHNEAQGNTALFRFFPNGGSTGGRIVLKLGERQVEIAVNWLTGAIVTTGGTGG